jgi:hypothetical protein
MELKSFVTQALVEITDAVKEAQEKTKENGALINPRLLYFGGDLAGNQVMLKEPGGKETRLGQVIEFDISVTASERDETQGGVGIQVASITIGAGVSGKTEDQSSVISRIKFSIPVFLPQDKTPQPYLA